MDSPTISLFVAYGLAVASELPVPFLSGMAGTSCDVGVEFGFPDPVSGGITTDFGHQFNRASAFLSFPGAQFGVMGGQRIVVRAEAGAALGTLQSYLLGPALGSALIQRGTVVLHASAVRVDGKVIAMVGNSGAGKSTLAARMMLDGADLISEDVLPVSAADGSISVGPGIPVLKLWPDACSLLDLDWDALDILDPATGQFRIDVQGAFVNRPVSLDLLVVLDPCANGDPIQLGQADAFLEITRNTYGASTLHVVGLAERQFRIAIEISRTVPVFRVPSLAPGCGPDAVAARVRDLLANA